MDVTRLLTITARIQANNEQNAATDIYQLANEVQRQFPNLCPKDLVKLIEYAVITIGGAAVWERPHRLH